MFGKPNTIYHFATMNHGEMKQRSAELEKSQKAKKKKINPKVINMLEEYVSAIQVVVPSSFCLSCFPNCASKALVISVEKRETELKKNLNTVLKDKEKIEVTIGELDLHKRATLQQTWDKVTV